MGLNQRLALNFGDWFILFFFEKSEINGIFLTMWLDIVFLFLFHRKYITIFTMKGKKEKLLDELKQSARNWVEIIK